MKKLKLKKGIGELLTKEQMKNVVGGEYTATKCTVRTNCATGYVECSSDVGKCTKGTTYVQCDDDRMIHCN